jgi:hypothetical protein
VSKKVHDKDDREWPIAPEPVPDEVVTKAKSAFKNRTEVDLSNDTPGSGSGRPSRRRRSSRTDDIAS